MQSWPKKPRTALLCCVLIVPAALAVAAVARAADQPVTTNQTLDDCKLIPDDGARLACYDRVIRAGRANVSAPPETAPPQAGAGSGAPAGSTPVTATAAPKTPEQIRAENEANYGLSQSQVETKKKKNKEVAEDTTVDKIELTIASTGQTPSGKLRLITTTGAVWDQVNGNPANPPAAGASVKVWTNLMGGHECRIGRAAPFDCQRVQ